MGRGRGKGRFGKKGMKRSSEMSKPAGDGMWVKVQPKPEDNGMCLRQWVRVDNGVPVGQPQPQPSDNGMRLRQPQPQPLNNGMALRQPAGRGGEQAWASFKCGAQFKSGRSEYGGRPGEVPTWPRKPNPGAGKANAGGSQPARNVRAAPSVPDLRGGGASNDVGKDEAGVTENGGEKSAESRQVRSSASSSELGAAVVPSPAVKVKKPPRPYWPKKPETVADGNEPSKAKTVECKTEAPKPKTVAVGSEPPKVQVPIQRVDSKMGLLPVEKEATDRTKTETSQVQFQRDVSEPKTETPRLMRKKKPLLYWPRKPETVETGSEHPKLQIEVQKEDPKMGLLPLENAADTRSETPQVQVHKDVPEPKTEALQVQFPKDVPELKRQAPQVVKAKKPRPYWPSKPETLEVGTDSPMVQIQREDSTMGLLPVEQDACEPKAGLSQTEKVVAESKKETSQVGKVAAESKAPTPAIQETTSMPEVVENPQRRNGAGGVVQQAAVSKPTVTKPKQKPRPFWPKKPVPANSSIAPNADNQPSAEADMAKNVQVNRTAHGASMDLVNGSDRAKDQFAVQPNGNTHDDKIQNVPTKPQTKGQQIEHTSHSNEQGQNATGTNGASSDAAVKPNSAKQTPRASTPPVQHYGWDEPNPQQSRQLKTATKTNLTAQRRGYDDTRSSSKPNGDYEERDQAPARPPRNSFAQGSSWAVRGSGCYHCGKEGHRRYECQEVCWRVQCRHEGRG
ncbi:hypothetical protein HK097_004734 [Rhizophlyctis rosea]|uniref:CCHC-type domain-containing protein n=1 Tax=Rhizophlyctis rosea TaxID=64517 RepID=A0AAD5WZB3_9FUNG|nr:hypothetical protein HK097_004734 [Rhizophlyctis rosea]